MKKQPRKSSAQKPANASQNAWAIPTKESLPSAVKRMISYQIQREMARQGFSQSQLAHEMGTSRAAVNRLLDPENRSVTLQTIERVAQILGKQVQVYIKD